MSVRRLISNHGAAIVWRAILASCLLVLVAVSLGSDEEVDAVGLTLAQPAPTTLAIVGVVNAGAPCPSAATAQPLPSFAAGESVSVCLSQPVPPGATVDITVGQMHSAVGEAIGNGVFIALPQQPNAGSYAVGGTINNAPLSPFLIRFFPSSKPKLTDMSPTNATRGTQVRINGDGLLAPVDQTTVSFGDESVVADAVSAEGSWVVATIPRTGSGSAQSSTGGQKTVKVAVWNVPATPPVDGLTLTLRQPVDGGVTLAIAFLAILPLVVIGGLVVALYYLTKPDGLQQATGTKRPSLPAALLVDPESQTYSLSRVQFFWWLIVISFAYMFLFVGHGVISGQWSFPPLAGYAYTLLISSGTLVLAIATSNVKGNKGSGAVHPAASDLIVHGGVVAPERVQQLLWTLIAGAALVWIVVSTYSTASALPDVPNELLTLMGLSSAVYLGGKLVRNAGPIIKQVDVVPPNSDPVVLDVSGSDLGSDASVFVDTDFLPQGKIVPKADPNNANFATQLTLTTVIPAADWLNKPHLIVVINSDGQRSERRKPAR